MQKKTLFLGALFSLVACISCSSLQYEIEQIEPLRSENNINLLVVTKNARLSGEDYEITPLDGGTLTGDIQQKQLTTEKAIESYKSIIPDMLAQALGTYGIRYKVSPISSMPSSGHVLKIDLRHVNSFSYTKSVASQRMGSSSSDTLGGLMTSRAASKMISKSNLPRAKIRIQLIHAPTGEVIINDTISKTCEQPSRSYTPDDAHAFLNNSGTQCLYETISEFALKMNNTLVADR